jgi:flagellar assembly factor FliW
MTIQGTRFGDIDYTTEDLISFPEGLIGFPAATEFVILNHRPDSAFRWLQSINDPALAFLVAQPEKYVPDYAPVLSEKDARILQIDAETPVMMFATANIPKGAPAEMTLNLAGPIVVNALSRVGRQVVLEDALYTVRHRVFQPAIRAEESVAA